MFHDDAMHLDMPIATVDQHTPVKQSVDLLDEPEFLLQQEAAGQLVVVGEIARRAGQPLAGRRDDLNHPELIGAEIG